MRTFFVTKIIFGLYFSAAFIILICGCGDNTGPAKVSGVVTLDGKPLPNTNVIFNPVSSNNLICAGGTDANGRYEIYYADRKSGAPVGLYKVTLTNGQSGENGMEEKPETVPEKYRDTTTTELEYNIKSGRNNINIDLKSN
jgi:hypothetical protein